MLSGSLTSPFTFLSCKMFFSGQPQEDMFPYGKADGAHSWHEGEDGKLVTELHFRSLILGH